MGERRASSDNMSTELVEYEVRVVLVNNYETEFDIRHAILEGLADNGIECKCISVSRGAEFTEVK